MKKTFIHLKTNIAKRFDTKVVTNEQIEIINAHDVKEQLFTDSGELECFVADEICRHGCVYNAHNFDEAAFYEEAEEYFGKRFCRLIDHQDCQTIEDIGCVDGGIYKVCISILEEKHVRLRDVIKSIAYVLKVYGLKRFFAHLSGDVQPRTMVYFNVYKPNGEPAWQCGRARGCRCT